MAAAGRGPQAACLWEPTLTPREICYQLASEANEAPNPPPPDHLHGSLGKGSGSSRVSLSLAEELPHFCHTTSPPPGSPRNCSPEPEAP